MMIDDGLLVETVWMVDVWMWWSEGQVTTWSMENVDEQTSKHSAHRPCSRRLFAAGTVRRLDISHQSVAE